MTRACFVVAVDGPAGAGKSTVARLVAERLGLRYLDSGALYRALGLAAIEDEVDLDDGEKLAELVHRRSITLAADGKSVLLDGIDVSGRIRSSEVGRAASKASRFVPVRRALVDLQRGVVSPPGAVAEGRDMGTVIFPDADLKVFLDASSEERVRRRATELGSADDEDLHERVRREINERDERDRKRAVAPLRVAPDALRIDSTALSIEQVVARIVAEAERRRGAK